MFLSRFGGSSEANAAGASATARGCPDAGGCGLGDIVDHPCGLVVDGVLIADGMLSPVASLSSCWHVSTGLAPMLLWSAWSSNGNTERVPGAS